MDPALKPDAPMDLKLANAMFGETVKEKPSEIAALFRELHQTKPVSPKRAMLSLELFKTLTMQPPVEQWKAFMSSGLHDVYFDILTDESIYEDDEEYLVNVMNGVWNIMLLAGVVETHRNPKVVNALLTRAPSLWSAIWLKRYLLQEQTPWAKHYRDAVSKTTFIFSNICWDRKTVPRILESRLGHITLYCWQFNPKWDDDDASVNALNILAADASSEDRNTFVKEAVIDTFGAQPFVERMRRELKMPKVIDHKLANRLHFMYHFAHHPVATRLLAALDMHVPVLDAIRRQKRKGDPELEWDVLRWAAALIYWVMVAENFILPDLIGRFNFIPTMARAAFLGATKAGRVNEFEDWITLQKLIGGVVEPIKDVEGFVIVGDLKRSLAKVWYPTLKDMRASKRGKGLSRVRDEMIRAWVKFGKDVGLDEDLEHHRIEKEAKQKGAGTSSGPVFCHWQECRYHKAEPPQSMSLCSGCNSVQYCDKTCQTRDWKEGGHKKECKVLKAKK